MIGIKVPLYHRQYPGYSLAAVTASPFQAVRPGVGFNDLLCAQVFPRPNCWLPYAEEAPDRRDKSRQESEACNKNP